MYHLAKLKWLIGREGTITLEPIVFFIEPGDTKSIPLNELHKEYAIVSTFEKNSDAFLLLESIKQIEEEIGNHL